MHVVMTVGVIWPLCHCVCTSAIPASGSLHGNLVRWKKQSMSASLQLSDQKKQETPGHSLARRV